MPDVGGDRQIEELEALIAEKEKGCGVLRDTFTAACGRALAEWYEMQVTRIVTTQSEHSNAKSDDEISMLKRESEGLVERAPEIASEALASDEIWLLKESSSELEKFSIASLAFIQKGRFEKTRSPDPPEVDKQPEIIVKALSQITHTPAIELLKSHGYDIPEFWPAFNWSVEMDACLAEYSEHFNVLVDLVMRHTEARRSKSESEAQDRWNRGYSTAC
jgi:hypothetical protein